ncbi:MAG TPA: terminase family protein [Longimicrobiales bacterium]|nr:terminase family protein [Longimicrobiales bacterium]
MTLSAAVQEIVERSVRREDSVVAALRSVAIRMAQPVDLGLVWQPHPGPQSAFTRATEFEVLYGGAAGGGKSDALLYESLRYIHRPTYRALILRHTFPELRELIDRSLFSFRRLGGAWNESKKRWTFPSGAVVEFGYCERFQDVLQYQGQEYQYIGFDELGLVAQERIWTFLISRCRTKDPSIPLRMRASANPGGAGHAWLKRRFINVCGKDGRAVYTDPETGLTRRFIPARLTDNPTLQKNNPRYEVQLRALPELDRRQLLEGDWDAGSGLALAEMDATIHIVDPFPIPDHWRLWSAFDWGYHHPFCFGQAARSDDGTVYLIDSVFGRKLLPSQIVERIRAAEEAAKATGRPGIDLARNSHTVAGHDCWAEVKARGETVPTIATQMAELGLPLRKASVSRVAGLNNLRHYTAWRGLGPNGSDTTPRFLIFDTPNNRRVFETLESMVTDPDNPEDALKIDADELGEGGDDAYDMVRYLLADWPLTVKRPDAPRPDPADYDDGLDRLVQALETRANTRRAF